MMALDECTSLKIRSMISRLDGIIARLEERYRRLYDKILFTEDCTRRQMYKNEAEEIRKIAKQLMTIQATLELMHGEQQLYPEVLRELERMVKSIMPELYLEFRELENAAQAAADEARRIIEESIAISDERMKFWGE